MIPYVYTVKVFPNCIIYKAISLNSNEEVEFEISDEVNQYEELFTHVMTPELLMIGFNNLAYDAKIIKNICNNYNIYSKMGSMELISFINKYSAEILGIDKSFMKFEIPQLDVYKIFNFDSAARNCSIRHCMISLRMPQVGDCPVDYKRHVPSNLKQEVKDYIEKEILAIRAVFNCALGKTDNSVYEGKNIITLRQNISKRYHKDFMNTSTIRIGEIIMRDLYLKRRGMKYSDLEALKTTPGEIKISECIPGFVKFKRKEFLDLLNTLLGKTIKETTGSIDEVVIFGGAKFYYGCGGLHQAAKGIFEASGDYVIMDADVTSLYPSIAVANNYYPKHLGPVFLEIYKELVNTRITEKLKPKVERDYTIIELFKLIINAIYGKSNEPTSFLYDPSYTMKTTITGECCLSMLIETLHEIPEIEYLNSNTDGLIVKFPREYLPLYFDICKEWESITNLSLEFNEYKKLIQRDVSNYIAVYTNNDLKLKGCFEIDQELHKNPSMRIVPIALRDYFVYNKPIKETIENHADILDFCIMTKCNKDYLLKTRKVTSNGIETINKGRILRYYIGGMCEELLKCSLNSGAESAICKGYGIKDLNDCVGDKISFNVNYSFYIKECRKIIDAIEDKQLKMF
jgi:hypothetical protein